jgi:hypothetical protein
MVRRLLLIFIIAATPCLCLRVFAVDYRPPTPEEQKVLDKYSEAIDKVLVQFADDDWEENVDQSLANAEVNPNTDLPLDVNSIVQRTYDVRGSSDRYREQILSLVKEMVQSSDLDRKKELNAQIQDLMHVQVQVRLNRANVPVDPVPPDNEDLRIAGTAFAYKIKKDAYPSGTAYVLFFGDARALEWDPEHNWFHYKFAHAANSACIENVEFRIYGADDRIQQLLHTVDWKQVNAALTP